MITVKGTILFEGSFWIGLFERTDKQGYAVARRVFGKEPSDAEVYEFVLQNYHELKFGAPQEFQLVIKRMNPKRLQREVRREVEKVKQNTKPSTQAQDYIRNELEKNKKERKLVSKKEKEAHLERQFLLKQSKRKEKHRGH
jgi:multidrug efflux pump subunit AcrB